MALFNANLLIRELRKAKGLTQEQLAEGICSRSTITMIEQGKRKPDWFTFSNIMKKLEVDPARYFSDIACEDEMYIYNQINIANKLLGTFDYEGLKLELEKIEKDKRFAKGLGYQVLLGYRSIFYSQEKYMDVELAFKYSMEYIRLFRPDFEIEKIPEYFLSDNDIKAINRLATVYNSMGDNERAIAIRYMLLENFERNYKVDIENSLRDTYIYTISNIARALVEEVGRHDECIQMANRGMELLKGSENVKAYVRLLYHRAYAYMYLGRKAEGEEDFRRCLMFSYAMGDSAPSDMAFEYHMTEFKRVFGYEIEVAVPKDAVQ